MLNNIVSSLSTREIDKVHRTDQQRDLILARASSAQTLLFEYSAGRISVGRVMFDLDLYYSDVVMVMAHLGLPMPKASSAVDADSAASQEFAVEAMRSKLVAE